MLSPWRRSKGAILVDAICSCGHKGKSEYPQHYQCSACFYAANASGNRRRAAELREKADKLEKEAEVFQAKSDEFRKRWASKGVSRKP